MWLNHHRLLRIFIIFYAHPAVPHQPRGLYIVARISSRRDFSRGPSDEWIDTTRNIQSWKPWPPLPPRGKCFTIFLRIIYKTPTHCFATRGFDIPINVRASKIFFFSFLSLFLSTRIPSCLTFHSHQALSFYRR